MIFPRKGLPEDGRRKASRIEILLALLSLLSVLALGVSSLLESQAAENRSAILSDVETPAASIIFTQRETLVYSTRLALWSNGGTTRREVQIARALLAQRLAVVDSSGRSMGSRARPSYWRALNAADSIVENSPAGTLPESMHPAVNRALIPLIDRIVDEARVLVVSYQKSVDQEMQRLAKETARKDSFNLGLLYLAIILGAFFLSINTRRNFANYRAVREKISGERLALADAERRVAQLQDLDKAKSDLIANVNHELRTPLTSILGYIELLQRENNANRTPQEITYIEVIQRNSLILLQLVESLLSLSKFDSAVGKLSTEPVNLNEVLDNAIFSLSPALQEAGITSHLECTDEIFVRGDSSQLSQVFINIIANAVKFSPRNSRIAISAAHAKSDSHSIEISISDQGMGIPEGELLSIFDRFFRASNVDISIHQGTGLGLAIVDQVISRHGGSIEVQSELAMGTTFTITLPAYQGEKKDG